MQISWCGSLLANRHDLPDTGSQPEAEPHPIGTAADQGHRAKPRPARHIGRRGIDPKETVHGENGRSTMTDDSAHGEGRELPREITGGDGSDRNDAGKV